MRTTVTLLGLLALCLTSLVNLSAPNGPQGDAASSQGENEAPSESAAAEPRTESDQTDVAEPLAADSKPATSEPATSNSAEVQAAEDALHETLQQLTRQVHAQTAKSDHSAQAARDLDALKAEVGKLKQLVVLYQAGDDRAAEPIRTALRRARSILQRLQTETDCPAPVACRNKDAQITVRIRSDRVDYTQKGVRSFVTIFSAAAARGVENATIRAMNATDAEADCEEITPFTPALEHPPATGPPATGPPTPRPDGPVKEGPSAEEGPPVGTEAPEGEEAPVEK